MFQKLRSIILIPNFFVQYMSKCLNEEKSSSRMAPAVFFITVGLSFPQGGSDHGPEQPGSKSIKIDNKNYNLSEF